jgi:ferric-dicitrate binding protein FerR (iron transport regulator)
MFSFNAVPLIRVIREIERQYAVTIEMNTQADYHYTGFFSKNKPLEQVLDIICKTFGLTFEEKSDKQYLIKQF